MWKECLKVMSLFVFILSLGSSWRRLFSFCFHSFLFLLLWASQNEAIRERPSCWPPSWPTPSSSETSCQGKPAAARATLTIWFQAYSWMGMYLLLYLVSTLCPFWMLFVTMWPKIKSWKQKLPLHTVLRLLQVLVPQVERLCLDK